MFDNWGYLLVELPNDDPELLLAFFAARFSFSVLLAAVFELFAPPLSLPAMPAPSVASSPPTLPQDLWKVAAITILSRGRAPR